MVFLRKEPNLNTELIDFHAHILPGADHGSDGRRTSADQLKMMAEAGIKKAIATPHFYPDRHTVDSFLARRDEAERDLDTLLFDGSPDVIPGAEVLVCEGLSRMDGLHKLTVRGTNTILLEMPLTAWTSKLLDTVEEIYKSSLTPVMAHIDRYPKRAVEELLEIGVKAQLNADALCRSFDRRKLIRYVEDGKIVAIGSDLHGAKKGGYTKFLSACKYLGDALPEIMKKSEALISPSVIFSERK